MPAISCWLPLVFFALCGQASHPRTKHAGLRINSLLSLRSHGPAIGVISCTVMAKMPCQAWSGARAANRVSNDVCCQQMIFARKGESTHAVGRLPDRRIAE